MKRAIIAFSIFYVSSQWGSDWYTCYMATNRYFAKRTLAAAKACLRPGDVVVVLN